MPEGGYNLRLPFLRRSHSLTGRAAAVCAAFPSAGQQSTSVRQRQGSASPTTPGEVQGDFYDLVAAAKPPRSGFKAIRPTAPPARLQASLGCSPVPRGGVWGGGGGPSEELVHAQSSLVIGHHLERSERFDHAVVLGLVRSLNGRCPALVRARDSQRRVRLVLSDRGPPQVDEGGRPRRLSRSGHGPLQPRAAGRTATAPRRSWSKF